ncbi:hypothetical protein [Streptomyces sp. NPDC049555]|uniref:endonuclease domain-containing protein n=1 Tax=Streptomyces sp. NPDC049555 TaxID=3154930 RepID=UPI0034126D9C
MRLRLLAVQLRHPGWVGSHRTAAAAHGIPVLRSPAIEAKAVERAEGEEAVEGVVELIDPDRKGQARTPGVVVHGLRLAEHEVTVVDGVRVTTALRTVCDLLMALPTHAAVVAADHVLARGLATGQQIAAFLGPEGTGAGRRNCRAARMALALTDPTAGSPAETMARLHLHGAGLYPESQAPVPTDNGRLLRVDFLFRKEGLALEVEGYTWHGSRAAHQNDILRFNELTACRGVRRVLRFSSADVFFRPRLVLRTVEAALAALREEGGETTDSPIVSADVHRTIPSHEGAIPCPSSTGSRPPTTRR